MGTCGLVDHSCQSIDLQVDAWVVFKLSSLGTSKEGECLERSRQTMFFRDSANIVPDQLGRIASLCSENQKGKQHAPKLQFLSQR